MHLDSHLTGLKLIRKCKAGYVLWSVLRNFPLGCFVLGRILYFHFRSTGGFYYIRNQSVSYRKIKGLFSWTNNVKVKPKLQGNKCQAQTTLKKVDQPHQSIWASLFLSRSRCSCLGRGVGVQSWAEQELRSATRSGIATAVVGDGKPVNRQVCKANR